MTDLTLLVIENPEAAYLDALRKLPATITLVVGNDLRVVEEGASRADAILAGMSKGSLLRAIFPKATRLRWVHSLSAGVENTLFPELATSPVTLTNGRGVFKRPLAEFVIAAALHFAKDLRRMLKNQEAGCWTQFDVEELHGKTMGIVGYGETGRATAELARPFGMKVLALRRRPELSRRDPLLAAVYAPDGLREMLAASDCVVLATPSTSETRHLIGRPEIASLKADAVLINVGRGSVVDEAALISALEANRIRGAALDVFETEPLPAGSPFYRLENVLLSPHCADHTTCWRELALECFLRNLERFQKEEPLENIVDKHAGY
jgi:phosphoglycerate dehydrogenase-like enzyme